MTDYTNSAQQRLVKLIVAMFGDVVDGYTPGELIAKTGASNHQMTRDLANLVIAGVAVKEENDRYRLNERLPRQAVKVWSTWERREAQLAESRSAIRRDDNY